MVVEIEVVSSLHLIMVMRLASSIRLWLLLLFCISAYDHLVKASAAASNEKIHFYESFNKSFHGRWIVSNNPDYRGVWKHSKGRGTNDYGLLVSEPAKKYAIAKGLDQSLNFEDKSVVVLQFEVRLQNGLDCGGAYLKYLRPQKAGWKPEDFDNTSPYSIMFGPDRCGGVDKVHFIFHHRNPITAKFVEHQLRFPPPMVNDNLTHVYTAVIKPNANELKILIDGTVKKEVNFLSEEDFQPTFIPHQMITDPIDKKPKEWDDREHIPDPNAVKPDDWDEDAPMEIEDENAVKPAGWLDDEPDEIDDPDAEEPPDWDELNDGKWKPPKIENPICAEAPGCGEWKKPTKWNPKYRGKWYPPPIKNPNYKGEWKPRQIENPDHFEADKPNFEPISGIGIEIWTLKDGILFDNILITSDERVAQTYRHTLWRPKFKIEKERGNEEDLAWYIAIYNAVADTLEDLFSPFIKYALQMARERPKLALSILISMAMAVITLNVKMLLDERKSVVKATKTRGVDSETSNVQQRKGSKEDEKDDVAAAAGPHRRSTRKKN